MRKEYHKLTISQLSKITEKKKDMIIGDRELTLFEVSSRLYSVMIYKGEKDVGYLKKRYKIISVGKLYNIPNGQAFLSKGGNLATIYEQEKTIKMKVPWHLRLIGYISGIRFGDVSVKVEK